MTTLAEATQPRDTSQMALLTAPAKPPLPPAVSSDADPQFNALSIAPIPPALGQQPDSQRQFYRSNVSQLRMLPIQPAANIATGAQAASQVIYNSVVGNSLILQTNNIDNPVQTILNLVGTGVTYGPNPGQVNIASGSSAPTVIDYTYSAISWFRDDFVWAISGSNGAPFGETGWNNIHSGGSVPTYGTGLPGHIGELILPNSASANSFVSMVHPSYSVSPYQTALDLLNNPGWKISIVWRWFASSPGNVAANFLQKTFYAGLCFYDGTMPARPCIFIGARYDTDNTAPAISDATIKLEAVVNALGSTRNNTQGTVVDTLITPAENTYYRLDIECIAAGVVTMSINGAAASSFTIPTATITDTASGAIAAADGYGTYQFTGQSGGEIPWSSGSLVTISGLTGPSAVLNGPQICAYNNDATQIVFPTTHTVTNANKAVSVVGYPALTCFFTWGNDTEATPAADTVLAMDFYAFEWNGALAGDTPSNTVSRYFGTV